LVDLGILALFLELQEAYPVASLLLSAARHLCCRYSTTLMLAALKTSVLNPRARHFEEFVEAPTGNRGVPEKPLRGSKSEASWHLHPKSASDSLD
jgi:hypothetical protein